MVIDDWMRQKNLSRYELSKKSGIPYTTLTDLIQKKTRLEKSSAETVYKLSKLSNTHARTLGTTINETV